MQKTRQRIVKSASDDSEEEGRRSETIGSTDVDSTRASFVDGHSVL